MSLYVRVCILAALVAFASACGSDNGDLNGAGPDAGDTPTADAGPQDSATVVSLGASEGAGIISTVGIPSLEVTQNAVEGVADADAAIRRIGDELYVLNRQRDNLTILDRDLELVDQFALGGGANPWDVARAGDAIYVAALDSRGVVVLDATDPSAGVVETIDLSDLDPGDDEPNCYALHVAGDNLLAACQRLDENSAPRDVGVIAVIDTNDHTVLDTFDLARENPFSRFVATAEDGALAGDLLLASVGGFDPAIGDFPLEDGCIERISLNAQPASEGCLLEHVDIGGWVGTLEIEADVLWLVASSQEGNFVVHYDLETEEFGEPLTADGQSPTDLAICPEGEIVVADNEFGAARGLRMFAGGEKLSDDLLDIGADPAFSTGLVCY